MSVFDDFDTSGIAGTTMQDTLNFEAARWLARRIPRNVEIAWDDYWDDNERAMGSTWPRFIPLLEEDADVEANIPWRRWLDAARGRERDLEWLIRRFEQLAPVRSRARRTLRFAAPSAPLASRESETLAHPQLDAAHASFFFHDEPLITRSQVSLARRTLAARSAAGQTLAAAKASPSCTRSAK